MLIAVGDFLHVHKSTASRTIHKVSAAIARLRPNYFPNDEAALTKTRCDFYKIAKFPKCVGAVDCTHVKIQSPGGNNAESYRNRKGYFSINVQCVCNPQLEITNIVARWPGSTHDSTIFNMSVLRQRFERREFGENFLVGDSGYGIKSYLITPLRNPVTQAEQLFNESQIRTRNAIERCFGVWKRRFPILALGIRLKTESIEAIIVATAVLHNICCRNREEHPHVDPELEERLLELEAEANHQVINENEHNATRQSLINYFEGLL